MNFAATRSGLGARLTKSILFFLFFAVFALATQVQAKEMASRLGVGYRNAFVTFQLPAIAAYYYPSNDLAVFGALGVDTLEDNSKFGFQGGVRRIIFKEENMNFFMGGAVAMVNQEVATKKDSGFELQATVGGEFYLPGLESLGFQFESGMGITNVSKTRFKTIGDSFVNMGMAFYF